MRFLLGGFTAVLISLFVAVGAQATPPPGTAAYTGASGTLGCFETPDAFTNALWYVGRSSAPPGWLKNFNPDTAPPAMINRDPSNVVRVDLDNACPSPVVIDFVNDAGDRIWGLVAAHTAYNLTGADLKLAGLWQFNIVGYGAGCVGGGPTCYDTPVDFIVTSAGVTPTP